MLALVTFLPATTVYAQTAADRETARLLMDRGDEQVERGDFEAALTLYRGADEIMRVPTTGIEVARTYARTGKLVEARDTALEVLRIPVAPDEPQPFKQAREAADRLARELARQIPLLTIEIVPTNALQDALLTVDTRPIPLATVGLPYSLNPTEHRVQVTAQGYVPLEQRVTLTQGERKVLRLELQVAANTLQASQRPGADGKLGTATHTSKNVNAPTAPILQPTRDKSRVTWPIWLGISVGGAGLIVGTVAGLVSLDRARDAKAYCEGNQCSQGAKDDRDAALLTANISNVGFAIGALGAATGVAAWWIGHVQPNQPVSASPPATVSMDVLSGARGCVLKWSGVL